MTAQKNQQRWVAIMGDTLTQEEKVYFKALGARIAQRRKSAGMTQVQVADALGIAQQTYASYEVGRRRIQVALLPILAQTLTMDIETLLGAPPSKGRGKRGPVPKYQQQIEQISQLPRAQQRWVMQMLETALTTARAQHSR